MSLRKCPACKDMVGAESGICPRCGVRFRSVTVRRVVLRAIAAATLGWLAIHFVV